MSTAHEAEDFDEEAGLAAFVDVFSTFIKKIPGNAWALTAEKAKEFKLPELLKGA